MPANDGDSTMNKPLIVVLGLFLSFASGAQEESREQEALERELAGEMVSIPGGTFRMVVLGSDQSNYLFPFSLYAGYGCYFSLKHSFCHQNRWYKRLAG